MIIHKLPVERNFFCREPVQMRCIIGIPNFNKAQKVRAFVRLVPEAAVKLPNNE